VPQDGRIDTAVAASAAVGEGVSRVAVLEAAELSEASAVAVKVATPFSSAAVKDVTVTAASTGTGVLDGVAVAGSSKVAIIVLGSWAIPVGAMLACKPSNEDINRAAKSVRIRTITRTRLVRKRDAADCWGSDIALFYVCLVQTVRVAAVHFGCHDWKQR
jgi:hypothetical protein